MWESIKCFFIQFNKWAWFGFLFVFSDLVNVYELIKPLLPEKWRDMPLPNGLGYIIGIIIILCASVKVYHNLRMKRMAELLEYSPELKKDKVFRIFSKLYKEGEFLKNASAERRQKWDEDVLIKMQEYCTFACKMNYLVDTGRKPDKASLLEDNYYDKAIDIIKDYLDNMFDNYTK